ncbi:hypothetical protein [Pseudomonas segetis]|uniref:Uncharacterized protein n=1 Tax=Pseudomonas segetis TaxID=298908 RepID=A0A239HVD9_9PSED|nr:hypothetical protein [Pseudomonas segetis]SNS85400.1 hypothetical protein SAMN05216255_3610 [Pseudomonas segetis]
MNYLITPPNTHYDGGLGITACNFSQAADSLREVKNLMIGILPTCYLQRHAIELFLKSLIVILHKKYGLTYGQGFSQEKPAIKVNTKWVPLSNTHNLLDLFNYFQEIFIPLIPELPSRTDWSLEPGIESKIKLISGSDPKSTYFRYPESTNSVQDSKKSSIQPETMESILGKFKAKKEFVKCTLLLDENDNLVQAYSLDHPPIPNTLAALKYLSEYFYNMHAAFRSEITKGF